MLFLLFLLVVLILVQVVSTTGNTTGTIAASVMILSVSINGVAPEDIPCPDNSEGMGNVRPLIDM